MRSYTPAKDIYKLVIERFPDSKDAANAQIDIPKVDIFILVNSDKSIDEVQAAIGNLIKNFKSNSYLATAISQIASLYFDKAHQPGFTGKEIDAKAKDFYAKSIAVRERIIQELSVSNETKNAYFSSAITFEYLENFEKAAEYYQKIINDWPDYVNAPSSRLRLGICYERLKDSGRMTEAQAEDKISKVYKEFLEKYPNDRFVDHAALKLGQISFGNSQWEDSVKYYKLYLEKTRDSRNIDALYNLALSYEKLGQAKQAIEAYKTFITEANPKDVRLGAAEESIIKLSQKP